MVKGLVRYQQAGNLHFDNVTQIPHLRIEWVARSVRSERDVASRHVTMPGLFYEPPLIPTEDNSDECSLIMAANSDAPIASPIIT